MTSAWRVREALHYQQWAGRDELTIDHCLPMAATGWSPRPNRAPLEAPFLLELLQYLGWYSRKPVVSVWSCTGHWHASAISCYSNHHDLLEQASQFVQGNKLPYMFIMHVHVSVQFFSDQNTGTIHIPTYMYFSTLLLCFISLNIS